MKFLLATSLYFTKIQLAKSDIYNLQQFYRSHDNSNIETIENYGCWCVFSDIVSGHGRPQDEMDAACKRLHDNYRCIVKDFKDEKLECDPVAVDYVFNKEEIFQTISEISNNSNSNNNNQHYLFDYCDHKNNPPCGRQACKADLNFLLESFPLMFNPSKVNQFFNRKDNHFDHTSQCGKNSPNRHDKIECCGTVPNQIIYSPEKTGLECCSAANQIFNPVTEICEGEYVVSLTSDLNVDRLVLDMSQDFDFDFA